MGQHPKSIASGLDGYQRLKRGWYIMIENAPRWVLPEAPNLKAQLRALEPMQRARRVGANGHRGDRNGAPANTPSCQPHQTEAKSSV